MFKTFIFTKNAFHFVLCTYSDHQKCRTILTYFFLFEKMKLVIPNHFNIVRLKTQSEKYMALKDKISKLVFLLEISSWSYTKKGFCRGVMSLCYLSQRL